MYIVTQRTDCNQKVEQDMSVAAPRRMFSPLAKPSLKGNRIWTQRWLESKAVGPPFFYNFTSGPDSGAGRHHSWSLHAIGSKKYPFRLRGFATTPITSKETKEPPSEWPVHHLKASLDDLGIELPKVQAILKDVQINGSRQAEKLCNCGIQQGDRRPCSLT